MLGHHGAANSSAEPWLDYWRPSTAVVQSGYQNRYGHPQPETLRRLCERTIELRRTDLEGAIEIHIGADGNIRWQSERSRAKRYWTRTLQSPSACRSELDNLLKEFNAHD
jgi:competence protein ComEC